MPRTLAIGDIHGHLEALLALEDLVPFREDDTLVFLGDYVDRGPHSKGVIEWLIERQPRGNVVTLLGNHDLMMRDAPEDDGVLDSWVVFGGDKTLLSYRPSEDKAVQFSDIPDEHWGFLRSCPLWHETASHIFVHAGVQPARPMSEQSETTMLWEKLSDPQPHFSGKTVVVGHTAQRFGWPFDAGHTICIDTWIYGDGWLTCLDVDSREIWQANKEGETRRGHLDSGPESEE